MKSISIPTSNRLDYLKEVIRGLLTNDEDLLKEYDLFFSCEPHSEVIIYLQNLKLPVKSLNIHINGARMGCVSNTYQSMILAFGANSDFGIYLEDDTIPACDLLNLANFYDSLPASENIMYQSFYAIQQGTQNQAIRQTDWFSGWGFCVTRKQWNQHFKDIWPTGWDTKELEYMRNNNLFGYYPEVSRIKNIGEIGYDYTPSLYQSHGLGNIILNNNRQTNFIFYNKHMYSQFGEDKWIEDYLVNNQIYIPALVMDIGAGDGIEASNSRLFIEKYGYKGILIDGNAEQCAKAKDLYKDTTIEIYNLLLADQRYKAKLKGEHWTLGNLEKDDKGKYTTKFSTWFKKQNIDQVGILSIDIENMTTTILRDIFDNLTIRPNILIIEGNTEKERMEQKEYLQRFSYALLHTIEVNQIFEYRP